MSKKIKWRKVGGGSLRLFIDGRLRIIKPNQVFEAAMEDIPSAFREGGGKVVIPVDPMEFQHRASQPVPSATKYELVHFRAGWYDVVNSATGKPMNDKKLRQADAMALLEQLNA